MHFEFELFKKVIDEIAFKYGYINESKLLKNANRYNNEYGRYLKSIIKW